jgi:hypothetical protein
VTVGTVPNAPTAPPGPPPRRPTQREVAQRAADVMISLGKLEAAFQPPRIVLNAVEGWGKSSCAAYAPEPAVLMAAGETGYQTLLGAGLVPQVDAAYVEDWAALLALLDRMGQVQAPQHKVLAFDALGGFERLCHEHVCRRDFNGEWGEKGFASYQKGYDVAVTDWLQFLQKLDRIRSRGVTILLLGHLQIRAFKNPLGEDYDRYVADVHHKTWGVTHKWADAVLFGTFRTVLDAKRGERPKGIGGTDRVLYCERRDAYDAKNRYGMPEEIDIPADPSRIWSTVWDAITKRKEVS